MSATPLKSKFQLPAAQLPLSGNEPATVVLAPTPKFHGPRHLTDINSPRDSGAASFICNPENRKCQPQRSLQVPALLQVRHR